MSINRNYFLVLVMSALGGCESQHPSSEPSAKSGVISKRYEEGVSTGTRGTATLRKSISGWVSCNEISDDTKGVVRAFQAASHNAFTLVVDCPVRLVIGTDIARTVFIDDGTTVEFTGSGKFTVDNVFHPAFVIANSRNITLTNWNVEYEASLPVDWDVGGYTNSGVFVARAGYAQPAFAFNDFRMTPWLAANRAMTFGAGRNSMWFGPTNTSAVFFISGDTSNVSVTGMHLYVPAGAGGDRFIPMAFSLTANYRSNQAVTKATPLTGQYLAIPHGLTFSNITLDGTYMGWQGAAQDVHFDHIRSQRYGDLQDANGQNVGGIGKWFAPPHLFYLSSPNPGDPVLGNQDISITNVTDEGPRIGVARDKGGTDTISGYALSLKIGCNACSVASYSTTRPDGFLDVLASDGLTISNVTATYDSAFLNNVYPGWRFPSSGYTNLTFENISFKDSAASSVQAPISKATAASNDNIVFTNVQVAINRWSGNGPLLPNIVGRENNLSLDYTIAADATRIMSQQKEQKGTVSLTLQATPATLNAGGTTVLTWTSKDATSCSGGGAWSGALTTGGSRTVKFSSAGNYGYAFNCQNPDDSLSIALPLVVSP